MSPVFKRLQGLQGAIVLTLILALAVHPALAFSQGDFHVAIVSKVYGYSQYIPRWSNVFKPGETLTLYLDADNVNVGRAAAVDFVVIIKDPNGYVVYGKVVSKKTLSYKNHIYTTVDIDVSKDWICGKYTIDAYAFNVLNSTKTELSYSNLYYKILYSGNTSPSVYTISRKNAPSAKETIYFYVRNKVPQLFYIFNEKLAAKTLPSNTPNKLEVSILNPMDIDGTTTVKAVVDGKVVDSKVVEIKAESIKKVDLTIPPLSTGNHLVKVVANNAKYLTSLPIVVPPLIYDKSIVAGDVLKGVVIYSPNNYVLGSVNVTPLTNSAKALTNLNKTSINREDAERMLTNMLAYIYLHENFHGIMRVAILDTSNDTAKKVLPVLLNEIKIETHAPIEYVGVRSPWNLDDVDVAFYVGSNPSGIHLMGLKYFFEKGGSLICDNPSYWNDYSGTLSGALLALGGWNTVGSERIYTSYYNLRIDKGIVITISKATAMPPKFVYSSLRVRGPPLSGMPPLVNVSTPVNISFTVKNIGRPGKERVRVIINGETVYNKSIFLYTGEVKNVTFQYVPTKPGSYKVMIPGTSYMQIFFVKSSTGQVGATPTPVKKPTEHRAGALFVAGSAVVLAVLVILRIFLKD